MSASKGQIKAWVEKGTERGATHVIIALDTWDYSNYPVYVDKGESVQEAVKRFDSTPNRIDEVYNLSQDIEEQLNAYRAWNL